MKSQKYWEHPLRIKHPIITVKKLKLLSLEIKPLAVKLSKTYYENI
jgi:predicted aspartyl protease